MVFIHEGDMASIPHKSMNVVFINMRKSLVSHAWGFDFNCVERLRYCASYRRTRSPPAILRRYQASTLWKLCWGKDKQLWSGRDLSGGTWVRLP